MRPETTEWIDDADYDLQSAKTMLDGGRYFFVVFMCHLKIEKLLKAAIETDGGGAGGRQCVSASCRRQRQITAHLTFAAFTR